jgi:hypothetical protein
MKIDPLSYILGKVQKLAEEKGLDKTIISEICADVNSEARDKYGNNTYHIQKFPSERHYVYARWFGYYEAQYLDGLKTRDEISVEIHNDTVDMIERRSDRKSSKDFTVNYVRRLLTDRELEKSRAKLKIINGSINDEALENGYVVVDEKGRHQLTLMD